MHPMMKNPAFQIFALCTIVLAIKMLLLASWTAVVRVRTKHFINPEDLKLTGTPLVEVEHPDVQRVHRAHRNDLENIPIFLIIALIYVMAGGSAIGTRAYCITFTAARVLHTFIYLAGKQPWRTVMYAVSTACTVGMCVQLTIWAIQA